MSWGPQMSCGYCSIGGWFSGSSSLDDELELATEFELFSDVLSVSKDKDPNRSERAPSSRIGDGGFLLLVELPCNGVSKGKPKDLLPCIDSKQAWKIFSRLGLSLDTKII